MAGGRRVVGGVAEAAGLLDLLVAEMVRRDAVRCNLPRLVVAIDELADLLQAGGKGVGEALTRLTQRGREAGIHVVAATQRPAAALVGGLVKANFPVRLVGSVVSPEDAKVAAGVGGTGAERLLGRGDFLLVAKGQVIRFQAAYAGASELLAVVTQVRAGGRRRRSWQAAGVRGQEPGVGVGVRSQGSSGGKSKLAGRLGRMNQCTFGPVTVSPCHRVTPSGRTGGMKRA